MDCAVSSNLAQCGRGRSSVPVGPKGVLTVQFGFERTPAEYRSTKRRSHFSKTHETFLGHQMRKSSLRFPQEQQSLSA